MPLIDMPLEELRHYNGISPKPQDFDAYWAASIAEMHSLGVSCELTKADFSAPGMECFNMYFTGVGKAKIHAKFIRPVNAASAPAVLMFHGYTGSSGDWMNLLSWASAGFCVAALDCRGQGGYSEDTGGVNGTTYKGHIIRGLTDDDPKKLLMRSIFLDTAQLARIVMAMDCVDENKVGTIGGSQGGALALVCAALEPRVTRVASMYPFLCDYKRVWEMDLAKDAYEEICTYFRAFDPRHQREEEIFTRLGYIDVQNLAPRIRAEVFMVTGLMDTICPPSTQFAAYNKITSAKKVDIYPDFGHEHILQAYDRYFMFMCEMMG